MNILKIILTLLPFVWTIGMIPFANKVYPIVLGLPFLAFWFVAGIFLAFVCLQAIYCIDSQYRKDS
jgi:heme/copper-type cytochrome/quinol oxidase subunit 4